MADDVTLQRLIKTGIGLYVIIFILIAIDLLNDAADGIDWAHITVELAVLLITMLGISFLGYVFYQNTQSTIDHLQADLATAQQEAKAWRNESHALIQGLGMEIKKQFIRWQLTPVECEIGLFILKGFSHQEIANIRQVSERTVREQARALYRKAGLTGRTSLSAFFLEDLLLPN